MRKDLREYVDYNFRTLESSNKDLKAVYEIMFRSGENILAETYEDHRIRKYTYAEVKALAEKAAAGIYERIGATHSFVALEMENCVNWIAAFWGILISGNKPYLVNTRLPRELTNSVLSTLGIKYIIGIGSTSLDGEFIDFDGLPASDAAAPDDAFENELALSTSATSLNEVICFYTGREISMQVLCAREILIKSDRVSKHYKNSLKLLAFLPFYHVFGLFAVYFWFTFFGRTIVFINDYSGDTILSACRRHEVTHIFAVPMLWHTVEKEIDRKLESYPEKKRKKFEKGLKICTSLQNVFPYVGSLISMRIMHEVTDQLFGRTVRFCISGGSYLRGSALELMNGLGYALHNGYGMTETGITSVELRHRPKDRNENSVGRPFSAVEYRVNDDGTLSVKGDTLCSRVIINGLETERGEWFDTGDIVEVKDGNYYVVGRKSDVFIGESGENVDPDVVEQAFDLPEAVSFSVLGTERGESDVLMMVVQVSRYMSATKTNALISKIYEVNGSLPLHSQIREFYITTDSIASEGAIKVSRNYLRRGIADGSVKLVPFAEYNSMTDGENGEYNSALADKVRAIVSEAIGVDASEIDDDANILTDLGATSLQYFTVLAKLGEAFPGGSSEDREKYCYTVREFCRYIERQL